MLDDKTRHNVTTDLMTLFSKYELSPEDIIYVLIAGMQVIVKASALLYGVDGKAVMKVVCETLTDMDMSEGRLVEKDDEQAAREAEINAALATFADLRAKGEA